MNLWFVPAIEKQYTSGAGVLKLFRNLVHNLYGIAIPVPLTSVATFR